MAVAPPQCLSAAQRTALAALVDTFMPSLSDDEIDAVLQQLKQGAPDRAPDSMPLDRSMVREYLSTTGAQVYVLAAIEEAMATRLNWNERTELSLLLAALSTRAGTAAVLCWSPFGRAFAERPRAEREAGMLFLASSPLSLHNKAFLGLKRLILALCLSATANESAALRNPFWHAIGYAPIAAVHPKPPANAAAAAGSATIQKQLLRLEDSQTELTVDCVVVGSGAGGSVAASELAKAGYSVLVLEKGKYIAPPAVTTLEKDGFDQMYEKAGLLTTVDGAISILAGSTMGGGTTINWGCCIQTPTFVRDEWSDPAGVHRLPQFARSVDGSAPSEFDSAREQVAKRLGIEVEVPDTPDGTRSAATASNDSSAICNMRPAPVTHNLANQLLLQGAASLGYEAKATGTNYVDTAAVSAGWSCFGDREQNKQGTLATYLVDACKNGARLVEGAAVERIITSLDSATGRRRATGVTALVKVSRPAEGSTPAFEEQTLRLSVHARRCVIVAAGSLHTPCVLLRSGFRNRNIGANLRLHPVTGAVGRFKGKQIRMYQGAPMTTVCAECELGPAKDYYGSKLEVPSVHPGLMAACIPWSGGADFKRDLLDLNDFSAIITLCRDKGHGSVRPSGTDPFAPPTVRYKLARADSRSMIHGLERAFRILAAAGSDRLVSLHSRQLLQCELPGNTQGQQSSHSASLEDFIRSVQAAGTAPNTVGLFSAHQMGSCRMGCSPVNSAIDCDGELWECDDLLVTDASTFPTASGANPMYTTLTIAQMLSSRLVRRLKAEDAIESVGEKLANGEPLHDVVLNPRINRRMVTGQTTPLHTSVTMTRLIFGLAIVAVAVAWMAA